MESGFGESKPRFATLQARLISLINSRINSGEFSERGLARLVGISQPQMHHLLHGARRLSSYVADLILAKLDLSILDLLTPSELTPSFRPVTDPLLGYILEATVASTAIQKKPASREVRMSSAVMKRAV